MTKRKPQIAYAPVDRKGRVWLYGIRSLASRARQEIIMDTGDSWSDLKRLGWRIARVRIGIDEETSGE